MDGPRRLALAWVVSGNRLSGSELGWGNVFVVPTRVHQGGRAGCVFVEETRQAPSYGFGDWWHVDWHDERIIGGTSGM